MTITAAQIQHARELLRMQPWQLAKLAGVSTAEVMVAEIEHADSSIARAHVEAIRLALEGAGIIFAAANETAPAFIYERAPESMSDQAVLGERAFKRIGRVPEIEVALGARLKALRLAADMSQSTLGAAIGVTFQQIQKYERGKSRIAASTLQMLAAALGVHPGSFFDGELSSPIGAVSDIRTELKGAAGLKRITDPGIRKRLAALIETLVDELKP